MRHEQQPPYGQTFFQYFLSRGGFEKAVPNVVCSPLSYRNGGVDEEGGQYGRRAHSGGEEPAVSSIQERDRGQKSFLEDNQQPRTERRN